MNSQYRDENLIKKLERDIEENECGASDCLFLFCCGIVGLVCVVPKYKKRELASKLLVEEMRKPMKPKNIDNELLFTDIPSHKEEQ